MSQDEASPPAAPLPLADLLAALRARGLPVGLREHLTVGRLLARWDDPDVATLRAALAAILARKPEEVALVRETFDQLYAPPPPEPERRTTMTRESPKRLWLAWAAAALVLIAALSFGGSLLWSRLHPPPPCNCEVPPDKPVPANAGSPPPPPRITDTRKVVNPGRRLTGAGAAAALVFLWLYAARAGRQAGLRGRRLLAAELDALPGPQGYDLVLSDLAPPFPSELLDDLAAILGRRTDDTPGGRELDVDPTLKRTLDAGLAPHIVYRIRTSTLPILVLEDVGDEMRPFRRRVEALLAGLASRGVHLDRWQFDVDADRLFRQGESAALALRQLMRRRAESPLLVISTGQGVLEGEERRLAAWVPALRYWKRRTWLHPATDPRAFRPALAEVPLDVWPTTRPGLLAAARQIARGDTRLLGLSAARTVSERAVTPLDVDRLRWLLSLAPRRDPALAELLRQRFCPEVPEAAVEEALESPPLATRPPIGLDDRAVHAYLARVLDDSRPEPGSAGHARWRLDRALQGLGMEKEAEPELADLAASPLGPEVERALRKRSAALPAETAQRLHAQVLKPLQRRVRQAGLADADALVGGRRWTWPTVGEIAACLVAAAAVWLILPFVDPLANDTEPLRLRTAYRLILAEEPSRGEPSSVTLRIQRIAEAPARVDLYMDERPHHLGMLLNEEYRALLVRGHWYYARARSGRDEIAISNSVWVEPARPASPSGLQPPPRAVTKEPVSTEPLQDPLSKIKLFSAWIDVTFINEIEKPVNEITYTAIGPDGRQTSGVAGVYLEVKKPGVWTVSAAPRGYLPVSRQVSFADRALDFPYFPEFKRIEFKLTPDLDPKRSLPSSNSPFSKVVSPPPATSTQSQQQAPQQRQQAYEPLSTGPTVERLGEISHIHLGCGEEKTQILTYLLKPGESYVSATVETVKASNMGGTVPNETVYDAETRTVLKSILLRGPTIYCLKGEDLDLRLRVMVRISPKAGA